MQNEWRIFFDKSGLSEHEKSACLEYVSCLIDKNVPVIFEILHFSKLIGVDVDLLYKIINAKKKFYRSFTIPKRKGGVREILSPFPILTEIQTWIFKNILSSISIDPACYGFVHGRNIVDNAKMHIGGEELLTIDIHDFFGAINENRVVSVFRSLGYSKRVSSDLASFCCLGGALPQGACTSPILSNIIATRIDERLSGLAKKLRLTYTRYADDMAFSGDRVPRNLIRTIETILREEGFAINKQKTKLKIGNGRKIVTGLLVNEDSVRVPKQYKRRIRQEIHYISKFGLSNHLKKKGEFDPIYIERLLGKLNFILTVEPDNVFALEAKKGLQESFINMT